MGAVGFTKQWLSAQDDMGSSLVSATDLDKSLLSGLWFPHLAIIELWFFFLFSMNHGQ